MQMRVGRVGAETKRRAIAQERARLMQRRLQGGVRTSRCFRSFRGGVFAEVETEGGGGGVLGEERGVGEIPAETLYSEMR